MSLLIKLAEDTMLNALFNTPIEVHPKQCDCTKRHRSRHTSEGNDEDHVRKREKMVV